MFHLLRLDRPGTDPASRRARMLYAVLWILLGLGALSAGLTSPLLHRPWLGLAMHGLALALVGMGLVAVRRGQVLQTGRLVIWGLSLLFALLGLGTGGLYGPMPWMSLALIVLAYFILGPRDGGRTALALCLWALVLAVAAPWVQGPPPAHPFTLLLQWWMTALGVAVIVHFAVSRAEEAELRREALLQEISQAEQALRRAEQAQREAAAEAQAANRSKSAFLANMSHELRTPLNAILGYSELLEEELDDPERRADLQRIHQAGTHLLALINGLLDLSRIEAGRLELAIEPVELDALLEEALDTVRPLALKNENTLELQREHPLGALVTDRQHLLQIVLNLLSNACKFTEKGRVTVVARRQPELLTLEVHDTGIGIPEDQLAQIFLPYAQAEPRRVQPFGGTGLGLALSRELARGLGGELHATSTPGEGSVFRLKLPPAPDPP